MKPLEAGSAHPGRRARNTAGQIVEGPAHADGHGDAESIPQPVDPQFLRGRAVCDEQDLGPVLMDQL